MLNSSTLRQTSLSSSVLSVTWVLRSAVHRKDIFWYPALVQSGERIPEMFFQFTAERRDFESHITEQTLLPVLAVRMWSCLTLIWTKCKSLIVPISCRLGANVLLSCRNLTKMFGSTDKFVFSPVIGPASVISVCVQDYEWKDSWASASDRKNTNGVSAAFSFH